MPCAAPSRNNLGVLGPCGYPNVQAVAGVDVSAQNLCYPHYAMKWGHAGIPKGLMGGIDENTVFCFHADSLADTQGHPLTAVGDAKISSAQSKFGSNALLLDGAGDYLTSPDSPDWAFGSGDFTIDFWAYFISTSSQHAPVGQFPSIPGQYSWVVRWDTPNWLRFYSSPDGTALTGAIWNWTPTLNTWYHLAVVRSGSNVLLFVNGVSQGAQAVAATLFDSNAPLALGSAANGGWYFNGYLDEVRISKGTARWTSNFAVPTAPYS
jgi:hypothetical protein